MSDRNLAAPFLLTAYEDIWRRMIWKFDARGFDFQCDNIHELNELALAVEKFSIHDRKKLGGSSKHGQAGKRQPDPPPGGKHGSV